MPPWKAARDEVKFKRDKDGVYSRTSSQFTHEGIKEEEKEATLGSTASSSSAIGSRNFGKGGKRTWGQHNEKGARTRDVVALSWNVASKEKIERPVSFVGSRYAALQTCRAGFPNPWEKKGERDCTPVLHLEQTSQADPTDRPGFTKGVGGCHILSWGRGPKVRRNITKKKRDLES